MMKWTILILLIFIPVLAFSQRMDSLIADANEDFNIILAVDFENSPLGTYLDEAILADWGYSTGIAPHNGVIKEEGENRYLEVQMPEGYYHRGQQWFTYLDSYTELYFSYNLMFRPGFDPRRGGKLPGFAGSGVDGGKIPTDAASIEANDGFSARNGWREYNQIAPYVYHHDLGGGYGEAMYFPNTRLDLSTERWYNITLRLVMNSFNGSTANKDGIMEGYLDGELILTRAGFRYREDPRVFCDKLFIATFFGGCSDEDRATRDEWIRFDDMVLFTYAEGVDVPRGNVTSPEGRILALPNLKGETVNPDADPEPPSVPGNVRVTDTTSTSLTVAWNESTDNVGVAGYRVFVNEVLVGAVIETSYKITDLMPEMDYLISVSAYDEATNESENSFPVIGRTLEADTEAPTIPSNIRIIRVTGYSIEFEWDPSTDNVGVDHYLIYLNGELDGYREVPNYAAFPLEPDKDYEITIRAVDAEGNQSPLSLPVTQRTDAPDDEAPSAPTGLRETGTTENTISLVWNASSDNVAVREYNVYVNNALRETSSQPSETLAQLEPGLEYNIAVTAVDDAYNESQRSASISVTTQNADVTTKPTLPGVRIVDKKDNTIRPRVTSDVDSLGFTDLISYGIQVVPVSDTMTGSLELLGQYDMEIVHPGRVESNLELLYDFSEGSGTVVHDLTENDAKLNLVINKQATTTEWLEGQGLRVLNPTVIKADRMPEELLNKLAQTNELTVEAWIKQAKIDQNGPASILSLSSEKDVLGVDLSHDGNVASYDYAARLHTSGTEADGAPVLGSTFDFTSKSLHHIVYTRDNTGLEKLYVNASDPSAGSRPGDFSSWSSGYTFALGNDPGETSPWTGTYFMVAVYSKAFNADMVKSNFEAGFGHIRFINQLDTLWPNVDYILTPFVTTSQGNVFGKPQNFIYQNVSLTDTLVAFYPNPNDGEFVVEIKNRDEGIKSATLRLADFAGQVHFTTDLDLSEGLLENQFLIQLPPTMESGFYTLMLIAGSKKVAGKLVLMR
jgi:chitodextrinase